MPTYDYKCGNCGNTFEIMQSIKDEPLKLCERCGHESLVKVISVPAGLIFKGSGFYLTDYAKKNTSTSSESGTKGKSVTDKKEKKETKNPDKPKPKND
ncbi:MAG: zinc ribbon domain-containing protein [Ignavibacteria bacterium]|nr:zinc ribbon domain-containing protein [Ignavibacteria bacterium]